MVPAGNKDKRLSSVNHTTKTIHHYHLHLHLHLPQPLVIFHCCFLHTSSSFFHLYTIFNINHSSFTVIPGYTAPSNIRLRVECSVHCHCFSCLSIAIHLMNPALYLTNAIALGQFLQHYQTLVLTSELSHGNIIFSPFPSFPSSKICRQFPVYLDIYILLHLNIWQLNIFTSLYNSFYYQRCTFTYSKFKVGLSPSENKIKAL